MDLSINIEKAKHLLIAEGYRVFSASKGRYGYKLSYECPRGTNRSQAVNDILHGHRCLCCRAKKPKAPILPIGFKHKNFEIVGHIGYTNKYQGMFMYRVRNVDNGMEGDFTKHDFLTQKRMLLTKEEIIKRGIEGSKKNRGRRIPSSAKYTWDDIRNKCASVKLKPIGIPTDNSLVFKSGKNGGWQFECQCGNIFSPILNNIINDNTTSCGCVKSRPQAEIGQLLSEWGIENIQNDRTVLPDRLELDIYVPSRKLAIEYCGLWWHGELIKPENRFRHYDKWRMCQDLGIRLITIFEDEWLRKQEVVKGYLKAILGLVTNRIGARKCVVERLTDTSFHSKYHLQGKSNGVVYGLVFKGEVVASAIFAKPNASRARRKEEGVWELTRYCLKPDTSIVGGLSKLIKAFKVDFPECLKLISYSDNRWSVGNIYRKTGFVLEQINRPSYWYFKAHRQDKREHRYRWRKSIAVKEFNANPNLTEWEIMKANGYDRIWDCGTVRWALVF